MFWEEEPCDSRLSRSPDPLLFFREVRKRRYELEPLIPDFAGFEGAGGKRVLEIGVGLGVDFAEWVRVEAQATGIDLTIRAVERTRIHLDLLGFHRHRYGLQRADAESLPFREDSFDVVYSWGVLHHTPRTDLAFAEAFRVLRPGGTLKAMIYHVPSWTAWLLWVRYGLLTAHARASIPGLLFRCLESPGTKAFTLEETEDLLSRIGFEKISLLPQLGPSDLLEIEFGEKYQGRVYRWMRALYPRKLVRMLGDRHGFLLLIRSTKPRRRRMGGKNACSPEEKRIPDGEGGAGEGAVGL